MNDQVEHKLVDDTLIRTSDGITARCTCGWQSSHFTRLSASSAFQDHKERHETWRQPKP